MTGGAHSSSSQADGGLPWRILLLAFVAGAAALQFQAELPALRGFWVLPPLALSLPLLPATGPGRILRAALLIALFAGLGFMYAAWRAELRLADELPVHWQGRDIELVGRVLGLPEQTPRGQRWVIEREQVLTPGAVVPERIQLSRIRPGMDEAPVRGGDCVRLRVRLNRPHGSVNPHGFDYEAWLIERGIRATGYLRAAPLQTDECAPSWRARLDALRASIRDRFQHALVTKPYAGVVVALAIGDQNAIPNEQWTLFRNTGVIHLMSISGMHVTLLSALVYAGLYRLWRRLPALVLRLPARRAATLLSLPVAVGYVLVAGFGIPAQRTLYMLLLVALALYFDRLHSPMRVLLAAAALVVLIDPWAALAPGFWLSFGAVAALFYAGVGALGRLSLPVLWIKTQWVATLALAPVLLTLFGEVSLVSPLANAFAIPLISLVAVPAALIGMLLPWDGGLWLAHEAVAIVMHGLYWLDRLPQPVWFGPRPGVWALALALFGVALLLMPRGLPGRWLGVVLCLPLLLPRLERPGAGEYWLDVLDVGQGNAVLVRTAGHALLYDSGPRYASGEDAGQRVVLPFIRAQGVRRLDALIVSHPDADHHGGSAAILAGLPVGRVATSFDLDTADGRQAEQCQAGAGWHWDGVGFHLLHPPARQYAMPGFSDNDRSCVLRIVARGGAALLPGDVERLAEMTLVEDQAGHLPADILLVPHHGSRSSSSPALLERARPRFALVSVGHRNAYGHPHPEVLARYRALDTTILRTDRHGALHLRVEAGGIRVNKARETQRRYWHR